MTPLRPAALNAALIETQRRAKRRARLILAGVWAVLTAGTAIAFAWQQYLGR